MESEKGSLVMERKWSLVEGKKGSQLKGRQGGGGVQSPVTSIEEKEGFNSTQKPARGM